jgi:tetratricopeptide (TPR) repeat protein
VNAVEVAGRLAAAERAQPRSILQRSVLRAKRIARHPASWLPLLGIVVALGVGKAGQVVMRRSLCQGGPARIAGIWDEKMRWNAQVAFEGTGHAGTAAFEVADRILKDHLRRWLTTYEDACEATHFRGEQSSEVLDLRMACLNEDLQTVRQLGEVFGQADRGVVQNAVQAAAALKNVDRCSDIQELRAAGHAQSASVQMTIDELRQKLASATALSDAGRYGAALEAAGPLVQEARATRFCPVIAEALFTRGYAGERLMSTAAFKSDLEEAVYAAERCGRDRVVAMASAELVYAERFNPNPTIPDRWAKLAEAAVERTGGDRLIECAVVGNRAAAEHHRGDFQAAVDDYRRALELATLARGADHVDVGVTLRNLSDALKDLGRFEEALSTSDRAIAILSHWLGTDHVDVAAAQSNRGDLLVAMKRYGDAERAYAAAIAGFESLPAGDYRRPYPLAGIGQVLLETGRAEAAIPKLESALSQIGADGDRFLRATVQANLGRALCESGGDCAHGRALAIEAAKIFGTADAYQRQADAIAGWLRAIPKRGR